MAELRPLCIALALLLGGCAVGPDYRRPDDNAPATFARTEPDAAASPQTDEAFWRGFCDPVLDGLVADALASNHTLEAAVARYERARALLRETGYDRFPTVTAQANATQRRLSTDQAFGQPRSQRSYDASAQASWELDAFGRIRRELEAGRADAVASDYDIATVQVAIVADLATTYARLRGDQERLRIARDNVDRQRQTLNLVRSRLQAGRGTDFDTTRAQAQLDTSLATIPVLRDAIAEAEHHLAILTGRTPESLIDRLETPATPLAIPAAIDPGTPMALLRRRPDIGAAEARLHAATANVGIATADLFPHLTFGAAFGAQTLRGGSLTDEASRSTTLGLGIDWSFLDVGRVRARIEASRADARGALAAYRQTVLEALEDTENALSGLAQARERDDRLASAANARAEAARIARQRYEAGAIDLLELLDAERDLLSAQDAYADAHAQGAQAAVALYRALAGGWPTPP